MIPKSSQRSDASGLAAHLLNAHDNEYVEVMFLQGGIADDLTGWAREKEASFLALTKGQNPFYHVQISPDFRQAWNDDLTFDYVDRILSGIGLECQDYALVRHIKPMPDGVSREHFHLVVSRLDINECKAIPISFDHIKLQYITRDFARDHDLELPPGYYNFDDRAKQTYRQQTLYEKKQIDRGLPTTEEHQEIITPLWKGRVSPDGFIKALDHHGYMLAVGRRPVLIDIHGTQHSLARLIDLKEVGVKEVRAYLSDAYNEDDLPSVEEAKAMVADHIAKTKAFERKDNIAEKIETLKSGQAVRRGKLDAEIVALLESNKAERINFDALALNERHTHRSAFLDKRREIRAAREEVKPTGLAAFLGRVSGMALVQKKIHAYRDRVALREHMEVKEAIAERQHMQSEELRLSHQMRSLDAERRLRELSYREAQELTSLKTHLEKQARLLARGINPAPSPAPQLELTPFGRRAMPAKAMTRYTGSSYKDRATKDEFHAHASKDKEDKLAPRKDEERTADLEPSRASVVPDPKTVEKIMQAPKEDAPSFIDIPTREVPAPNENLRQARKRGVAVPKPGELTSRFDEAAQFSHDFEKRSSGGKDSQAPATINHADVEISKLEKSLPPPGGLSDHAAIALQGRGITPTPDIEPDGQAKSAADEVDKSHGPERPFDELDYERDR